VKVSRSAVVGVVAAAVLIAGAAFAVVSPRALGAKSHQFQISFTTADGLVAGSDVLEAGSKVGTISDIQPTQDNSALVTVQISDANWPLHTGLTADIRPKSLLGEKYVDLHDGKASGAAYDTTVIFHATQQAVPVELDQFINSLDAPTRSAAKVLLNDLGAGVAGRGLALNEAIAAGKANLQNLAVFGTTLNNRDPDLDRILVGLDGVLGKLTQSDQLTQLSQLITNGQTTLNAIETQQAAFSRGFVDAQTALGELNTAFDSAVPSLRGTLSIAPTLLTSASTEANLLQFLASQANVPGVLPALDAGLQQGPTTTGGALESTFNQSGDPVKEPIFRVCLVSPQPAASGNTSCQGSGFARTPGSSVPSAYHGGQSNVSLLSLWLAS
jgi:phospholipid/cholesterol/gamma-HCH transport system substrate-binding protein